MGWLGDNATLRHKPAARTRCQDSLRLQTCSSWDVLVYCAKRLRSSRRTWETHQCWTPSQRVWMATRRHWKGHGNSKSTGNRSRSRCLDPSYVHRQSSRTLVIRRSQTAQFHSQGLRQSSHRHCGHHGNLKRPNVSSLPFVDDPLPRLPATLPIWCALDFPTSWSVLWLRWWSCEKVRQFRISSPRWRSPETLRYLDLLTINSIKSRG